MNQVEQRFACWAVSGFIILILASQVFANVYGAYLKGWPIITYPMYSKPHYDGERLDHDYLVSAVLDDQTEVAIDRVEMGMNFWMFHSNVFLPIKLKKIDLLIAIVNDVCSRYDNRVIALTARDLGMAITRDGPVDGLPPIELGRVDVTCDGNGPT